MSAWYWGGSPWSRGGGLPGPGGGGCLPGPGGGGWWVSPLSGGVCLVPGGSAWSGGVWHPSMH